MNNCFSIRLLRERLSEKVHATFPKGILCGFELTVRSHERPWTYVCEWQRKAPEVGSTATECQEQCIDHIPYHLSGLSRAHFFLPPFSKELRLINGWIRALMTKQICGKFQVALYFRTIRRLFCLDIEEECIFIQCYIFKKDNFSALSNTPYSQMADTREKTGA